MFLRLGIQEVDTVEEYTTSGNFYDMPALPEERLDAAKELASRAAAILLKIKHERS
jgi:hypothetical protein